MAFSRVLVALGCAVLLASAQMARAETYNKTFALEMAYMAAAAYVHRPARHATHALP